MTLVFTRQGKPDMRMIEYDQAVVRLGLEKADVEKEIDRKNRELKQLGIAHELIRYAIKNDYSKLTKEKQKEIDQQVGVLSMYDIKFFEAKKSLDGLAVQRKNLENQLETDSQKLVSIKSELEIIGNKKKSISEELERLDETRITKVGAVEAVVNSLRKYEKDKESIASEVYELAVRKKDINGELETKHTELKELNEIISVLQTSNKDGLNLVSSFEGERKRLKEKEEFLIRKEDDLAVYERRLKKYCEKAGYNVEMIFK